MSKKGSSIGSVLIIFVVVLCLGTLGAGLYYGLSNGEIKDIISDNKTTNKTENNLFGIEIDGEKFYASTSRYIISQEDSLEVKVFNTSEYILELYPACDFIFTVDGDSYSFVGLDNLIDGFIVDKTKDFFSISPKGGMTTILENCFPNTEINVNDLNIPYSKTLFTLVVYNKDKTEYVLVNFSIVPLDVIGVYLNEEVITF